ncbi:MAG: FGGY family carbohydrate kinase [Spirochaetota bacterium]
MRDLAVGIDIGTTAIKALVVDMGGQIVHEASLPHELESPRTGFAEESATIWWRNPKSLLAGIARAVDTARLGAVGFSGMVPTLILVDGDGEPLYPSIQQNDARATEEIGHFKTVIDETDFFRRTGNTINQQVIFPKFRWMETHHPELIPRVRYLMGSYNYCTYRLTGVATLERNWALESGMWLVREEEWAQDILHLANISEEMLPPVHASIHVVGTTTAEVELETGFPSGIPVIAGSADHVASALATGVQDDGDLLLKLGGAGDILLATREIKLDPRLFIDYHPLEGRYLLNGCMASSGSIVKWYTAQLGVGDLEDLSLHASGIPPGSDGLILLPYFIGEKTPIFDVDARGVYFGLSLFHTKHHLFRAILEGVAYGFMHHIEVMSEMGLAVRKVYLSNGGARSDLWKRIVLDAVGKPGMYVPNHPGSSLGAAFLAAQGTGMAKNWEGLKSFLAKGVPIPFDPKNHETYQRYFDLYKRLYLSLKPLFGELARESKSTEVKSNE